MTPYLNRKSPFFNISQKICLHIDIIFLKTVTDVALYFQKSAQDNFRTLKLVKQVLVLKLTEKCHKKWPIL